MLISSDLSEIVNLSHRVYILSEDNLCAEFNAEDCSEHLIQSYFIKSKAQIVEAS
jgi:ABC-type sugar transport system ATPase subunit